MSFDEEKLNALLLAVAGGDATEAPATGLEPGVVVAGQYEIVRLLARGGMGEVFLAQDALLEREVVVKTVRIPRAAPAVLQERLRLFEREARALAAVVHPNIVSIFGFGYFERTPFMVLEYLHGETLSLRLERAASELEVCAC